MAEIWALREATIWTSIGDANVEKNNKFYVRFRLEWYTQR